MHSKINNKNRKFVIKNLFRIFVLYATETFAGNFILTPSTQINELLHSRISFYCLPCYNGTISTDATKFPPES